MDLTKAHGGPYGKFNGKELQYLAQALDSEAENKRSWVTEFESRFSQKLGSKYAIAVNSGTSGLHAALWAAGVGPGDEVIQPAINVVMDAYVTLHLGAIPVFADVNHETWNIDINDLESKITTKTKAIIVVSLYGLPVDIEPILKLCREKNIVLIDDSAETLMGYYRNRVAGTLADISVFSFENTKHISSGSEGGMIITNNEKLATRARKYAGIGYKGLTAQAGRTSLASSIYQDPNYERFDTIGLNYRMNVVTAAVGLAQFERVDQIVARRQQVAKLFLDAMGGCTFLVPQHVPDDCIHAYFTLGVAYLGEEQYKIAWKDFYNRYKSMGGDGFYACWINPYLEPSLRYKTFGPVVYDRGLCPVAEDLQQKIIALKTNYRNLDEAKRQAELLKTLIQTIQKQ